MNRIVLFAIVGVLLSFQAFAGKQSDFHFDSTLVHRGSSVFHFVHVADQRKHPEDLGIFRGGFRGKNDVTIRDEFAQSLSKFANNILAGVKYSKADTLLLVLYDFTFDQLSDATIGTFYLKAQLFCGGNNQYFLLKDIDSIYETVESVKALKAMPSNILFENIRDIALYKVKATDSTSYTFNEACNKVESEKHFPVYTCNGEFKKGIYLTYSDFLNQTPSEALFIQKDHYIENKVHKPEFFYQNEKGKRGTRIESVFAIYNGQNWYLPKGDEWVRFRYEEGDFYRKQQFYGIRHVSKDYVGVAAMMFGVVGAVTAAVIAEGATGSGKQGLGVYEARLQPRTNTYKPVKRLF